MEEYKFYQDKRVKVWQRSHFKVKAENRDDALNKVRAIKYQDVIDVDEKNINFTESEILFDTMSDIELKDNNNHATMEIYEGKANEMIANNMEDIFIYNQETVSDSIRILNYLNENNMSDWTELFDNNPDIIKIRGREYPFSHIKNNFDMFVIYIDVEYDDARNDIENLLKKFFSNNFINCFEKQECLWSSFNQKNSSRLASG